MDFFLMLFGFVGENIRLAIVFAFSNDGKRA